MIDLNLNFPAPGLLVSVRDASEALAALEAGADVIDVKEPNRGALGAPDATTLAAIVDAVDGRTMVTVAIGELSDLVSLESAGARGPLPIIPAGVSLFKLGLAGCSRIHDWQTRWQNVITSVRNTNANLPPQPVAVVYADWQLASAPEPGDVLNAAIEARCPALLIDTWNKSAGGLFDHFPVDRVRAFLDRCRSHNLVVVLAGSLTGESFKQAVQLLPHLVAVRTAACDAGRNGRVSTHRVRDLKQTIVANTSVATY